MKYLVRVFLFNTFGLWLTSQILPFFTIGTSWEAILFAGLVLSILMLIVKPILHILLIPINIMTFGLISWAVNVIVVYLMTLIEPTIQVMPWQFPGFTWAGFVLPPMAFSYIISLICATLTLTFITNVLHKLSED